MTEKLKLVDPHWMLWRVLRRDTVVVSNGTSEDHLSWHPLNVVQALFLNYHGTYNVKPDTWWEVTTKPEEAVWFNQPVAPGYWLKRWKKVERPV